MSQWDTASQSYIVWRPLARNRNLPYISKIRTLTISFSVLGLSHYGSLSLQKCRFQGPNVQHNYHHSSSDPDETLQDRYTPLGTQKER